MGTAWRAAMATATAAAAPPRIAPARRALSSSSSTPTPTPTPTQTPPPAQTQAGESRPPLLNDDPAGFVPAELIRKKREGKVLTTAEINWLVSEYHEGGAIRDYQMSALLMAICIKGMNEKEAADLTRAMIATGETRDFSERLAASRGLSLIHI